MSVSTLQHYAEARIHIFPKKITFAAYEFMLGLSALWRSYGATIFITVVGTAINMVLTIMAGYVLSKSYIIGQQVIMFFVVFASGGTEGAAADKPYPLTFMTLGDSAARALKEGGDRIIDEINRRLGIELTVRGAIQGGDAAITSGDFPDVVVQGFPSYSVKK